MCIANGSGTRTCNSTGTDYGSRAVASCSSGYSSNGSSCVDTCSITSTIGATCSDGSKYVGSYNGYRYALSTTQGSSAWAPTNSTANSNNQQDGMVNANYLYNTYGAISFPSSFPAVNYCYKKTFHAKSDWYLPANSEMANIYQNICNAGQSSLIVTACSGATTGTSSLWTSYSQASNRQFTYFSAGLGRTSSTTVSTDVRSVICVRKL